MSLPLTPDQQRRYFGLLLSDAGDRIYNYVSPLDQKNYTIPLSQFIADYTQQLRPFVENIELKGGTVHYIIAGGLLQLSDLDIDIWLKKEGWNPYNPYAIWERVDQAFLLTLSRFVPGVKENPHLLWRSKRHLEIKQVAQNAFSLQGLPTQKGGVQQNLDFRIVAYSSNSCLGSADSLHIDLKPLLQVTQNTQRGWLQVQMWSVDGYKAEEALALLQERRFTVLPIDRIPTIDQAFRCYCRCLSRGYYPVSHEIEMRFAKELLPPLKAQLESYLNRHYPDDVQGQLIYLFNYYHILARTQSLVLEQTDSLFQIICNRLGCPNLGYSENDKIHFFEWGTVYLALRAPDWKSAIGWGENTFQFHAQREGQTIGNDHLFFTANEKMFKSLREPNVDVMTHRLLQALYRTFPCHSESPLDFLQREINARFPKVRLENLLPDQKKISEWYRNGESKTEEEEIFFAQILVNLWNTAQIEEPLADIPLSEPFYTEFFDRFGREQNWKLVRWLYAQKREAALLQKLKNPPLLLVGELLSMAKDASEYLRSLKIKQRVQLLEKAPLSLVQAYLKNTGDREPVSQLLQKHPDLFYEEGILSAPLFDLAAPFIPSVDEPLAQAPDAVFIENFPRLFVAFYPKQAMERSLERFTREREADSVPILEHLSRRTDLLMKTFRFKEWFLEKAKLIEKPSSLLQQGIQCLSKAPLSEPKQKKAPTLNEWLQKPVEQRDGAWVKQIGAFFRSTTSGFLKKEEELLQKKLSEIKDLSLSLLLEISEALPPHFLEPLLTKLYRQAQWNTLSQFAIASRSISFREFNLNNPLPLSVLFNLIPQLGNASYGAGLLADCTTAKNLSKIQPFLKKQSREFLSSYTEILTEKQSCVIPLLWETFGISVWTTKTPSYALLLEYLAEDLSRLKTEEDEKSFLRLAAELSPLPAKIALARKFLSPSPDWKESIKKFAVKEKAMQKSAIATLDRDLEILGQRPNLSSATKERLTIYRLQTLLSSAWRETPSAETQSALCHFLVSAFREKTLSLARLLTINPPRALKDELRPTSFWFDVICLLLLSKNGFPLVVKTVEEIEQTLETPEEKQQFFLRTQQAISSPVLDQIYGDLQPQSPIHKEWLEQQRLRLPEYADQISKRFLSALPLE